MEKKIDVTNVVENVVEESTETKGFFDKIKNLKKTKETEKVESEEKPKKNYGKAIALGLGGLALGGLGFLIGRKTESGDDYEDNVYIEECQVCQGCSEDEETE